MNGGQLGGTNIEYVTNKSLLMLIVEKMKSLDATRDPFSECQVKIEIYNILMNKTMNTIICLKKLCLQSKKKSKFNIL